MTKRRIRNTKCEEKIAVQKIHSLCDLNLGISKVIMYVFFGSCFDFLVFGLTNFF